MSNDKAKIRCEIDGALVHSVQHHIRDNHPDWDIDRYRATYKNAPLLSDTAKNMLTRRKAEKEAAKVEDSVLRQPIDSLFGFPAAAVTNSQGQVMQARVLDLATINADDQAFIPDQDPDFIFNIDLVKIALMTLEMRTPGLLWGLHGTGKTSIWEQVCAKTNRPFQRVQHTINTEEAHVLGQYVVRQKVHTTDVAREVTGPDGKKTTVIEQVEHVHAVTEFNLGPLPIAMMNGHVYCADEYDFGLPSVLAVYQPVMEGKALVIKDAPPEYRVIRPHPNFRFVATGNTNGGGDETGLYQGTQIQNAANYSRFGITAEVGYLDGKVEAAIVAGKSGCRMEEAKNIIKYADEIRKQFRAGAISSTISPRELINAANWGCAMGGNWRNGLNLAFANRLSRTDREVCDQFAQRLFG
jgi:cobaltochelatase CobS